MEIVIPVEDSALRSTDARQLRALVLTLCRVNLSFPKEHYWMLGWRMGQILYGKGTASMWGGLVDFLNASDRLKNERPPPSSETMEMLKFYRRVQEEK